MQHPAPLAIIIMGVSGSGKSTLGMRLAEALDLPFLEGDAFHDAAAVAKMRGGEPLTDEDRWPWLDRLGAAMKAAIAADGGVVAACSALRETYRQRLRDAVGAPTRLVLLEAGRDALFDRLSNRPDHYMPARLLDSQLNTLERPAPDPLILALDCTASPEALCDAALAWLKAARD